MSASSPPSGRLIGYARVSTDDQTPALQLDALRGAGVTEVFEDRGISGAARDRPGLRRALAALQADDVLVVWKLDRLGRSLSDPIDTTTAGGMMVFHVLGALAEFERSLITERTRAGLAAAKRRGAKLGRRHSLTAPQIGHARKLIEGGESPASVARSLGVSRSTLYRSFAREGN